MRKVLIIAYHFPPSNAVGALRPAKFAEYLPEFGWEPIVLAAAGEAVQEPVQFAELPGVPVHLSKVWPGPRDLLMGIVRAIRAEPRSEAVAGQEAAESGWSVPSSGHPFLQRLRWLAYSLMWLPDDRQGWIIPAVIGGVSAFREFRPSAILATSPPHSGQLAAMLISRITGVPLICDFRDPWTGGHTRPEFIETGGASHINLRLERSVLRAARTIVCATPSHAKYLALTHGIREEKVRVVENGFDPVDFEGIRKGSNEVFTITYTGNFYHTRTPRPLFAALKYFCEKEGLPPDAIRVQLVGDCEFAEGRSVTEIADEEDCRSPIELCGRLPHRVALEKLVNSDLLVLLASGQPDQVPTKAYEYMAAGSPILAFTEEGATADAVRRCGNATIISSDDPREISVAIGNYYGRRRATAKHLPDEAWVCPPTAVRWDRRLCTRKLAHLLSEAVNGRGRW